MKTALIVIDVQNFFVVENALGLPEKIVDHIEGNKNKYDYILFTLCYYDSKSNFEKILHWKGPYKSPEVNLHSALVPFATPETTFSKTTYSAFKSKELLDFLKNNKVSRIKLCGINTDACVLSSGFEAFDLGFDVEILEDLCSVSSANVDYEKSAKVIIKRNLRSKNG